jgi:thiol-disulfide isomerase/thioredoxin
MDRLSTLIAVAAVLAGCESKQAGEPPSRANVGTVAKTTVSVEELCDRYFPGDTGPLLKLPAVVDGTVTPTATTWRWINIWSTWCKPCVEEIPRLVRWRDTFARAGTQIDLAFISIDEDAKDLAEYRTEHPEMPPSPRIADAAKQGDWYTSVGLDAAAPVPVHVFVRPSGHVACARAGGIRDRDLPAVEKLLAK